MKKILEWLKGPKSDFILFLIFIVLINLAGQGIFKKWDLTEPKSYSLSKESVSIVKNLDEPLSIRVFFDKNLPAMYSSVEQYVEDLLGEYKAAANKNFSVSIMDMSKPENVEIAQDFGLRQVQIQEVKNDGVGFKQAYMGLVVSYGDAIQTVDPITQADGFEYKLTSTISKMMNEVNSLAVLKGDEKIDVTVYLSTSIAAMINGADQIEKYVEAACKEVNKQKMDKLNFKAVHPSESEVKDLIDQYGIQGLSYKENGVKKSAALGVVLSYKDNFRVLPVQVQNSFFGYAVAGLDSLEDSINENIQSLISKPTEIGYVLGHNELPLDDEKYAANFDIVIRENYTLVDLDLSESDIPASMKSIVINGPQFDFTEEELYKIDQFIMRGGNVMFFIDGMNTNGQNAYYQGMPQYSKNIVNLDRLLNTYGVQRGQDFVMDKNCYKNMNQQYGELCLYWAPILQKKQLANHPITKNLGYVVMLENSSLDASEAKANKDVKVTVLAKSSDEAWVVDKEDTILNPMMITPPSDPASLSSHDLAILIEGKFKSAFDEAPEPEPDEDEEGEEAEVQPKLPEGDITASNHLSSSKLPGKIFVTGTSYITTYQVLDSEGTTPIALFIQNLIDYMNGNEDLCTMRTKGLSVNTLTIKSKKASTVVQYLMVFGLAVLAAIAGLIVLRLRAKRKSRINKKYNPNDQRQIERKGGVKNED